MLTDLWQITTLAIDTAVFLLCLCPSWWALTRSYSSALQVLTLLAAITALSAYTCIVPWWAYG